MSWKYKDRKSARAERVQSSESARAGRVRGLEEFDGWKRARAGRVWRPTEGVRGRADASEMTAMAESILTEVTTRAQG